MPRGAGIVHQVNLEYLARVVFDREHGDVRQAYPDTLIGTDLHTTRSTAWGVLGWGVGGIEAGAAMPGLPVTMLIPQVVGFRLDGSLGEGTTATDLVLRVTEMLRAHGVVGKFVEFFGDGLRHLPVADRATIANMAPSTARPATSSRSTPRPCVTSSSPGGRPRRLRWSRRMPALKACFESTAHRRRLTVTCSNWNSPASNRAWPGTDTHRIASA